MKNFFVFFKKIFEKVFELPKLLELRFFTKRWSYLFIYISYANKNYILKLSITLSIFKSSQENQLQNGIIVPNQYLKFNKKQGVCILRLRAIQKDKEGLMLE